MINLYLTEDQVNTLRELVNIEWQEEISDRVNNSYAWSSMSTRDKLRSYMRAKRLEELRWILDDELIP